MPEEFEAQDGVGIWHCIAGCIQYVYIKIIFVQVISIFVKSEVYKNH
jgi:hypothetical protein